MSSEMDSKKQMAMGLGNLGDTYFEKGDLNLCEDSLKESLKISQSIGSQSIECETLYYLSKKYHYNNEADKAIKTLNEMIDICNALDDSNNLSKAYLLLSKSLHLNQDIDESYHAIEKSIDISEKIKNQFIRQDSDIFKSYLDFCRGSDFSLEDFNKLNKKLDDKSLAFFYFLKSKITKNDEDSEIARDMFYKLYNLKKSFIYKFYLKQINS